MEYQDKSDLVDYVAERMPLEKIFPKGIEKKLCLPCAPYSNGE